MSNQKMRKLLGLESIEKMVQRRRLQWVAHRARRGEADLTWRLMRREVEDADSEEQARKDWEKLGVRARNGALAAGLSGSILVPQGHKGPAFMAYPNFRVYFKWNQSFENSKLKTIPCLRSVPRLDHQ